MSLIQQVKINKSSGNLSKEHWIFILALINDHAFRGSQIEIAFEIKQIIHSKIQGTGV
tara:strand:- start:2046 stop:2219 length:174 start_codon:yes stop_codon:yes gene_type:complete